MKGIPLALLALVTTALAQAEQPLVFVSAFASAEKAGIHAFGFDSEKGTLKPLKRTTGVQSPFFIALSPDRRFLYSIDEFGGKDNFVAAFAIEGREGDLRALNRQNSRGKASCYVEVDPTGKSVLVANYSSGNVASLPVMGDGSLGESVSFSSTAAPAAIRSGRKARTRIALSSAPMANTLSPPISASTRS